MKVWTRVSSYLHSKYNVHNFRSDCFYISFQSFKIFGKVNIGIYSLFFILFWDGSFQNVPIKFSLCLGVPLLLSAMKWIFRLVSSGLYGIMFVSNRIAAVRNNTYMPIKIKPKNLFAWNRSAVKVMIVVRRITVMEAYNKAIILSKCSCN